MKDDTTLASLLVFLTGLILISLVSSCGEPRKKVNKMKHKEGDIVYIKPDSTKGFIEYVGEDTYTVGYFDKLGKRQYVNFVSDSELY